MTFLTTYLYGGLAIGAMITLLWVVSLLIRNSAIIDTFWSIGFLLSGAVYLSFGNLSDERALLLYGLMLLWGIRLSLHILIRSWGKPEDALQRMAS